MTLLVDPRAGSGEMQGYLKDHLHLPAEHSPLAFADFAFLGHGEDDSPVSIGIERKALPDFVTSMYDGRLPGHQLPGLLSNYQEVWIVVEGLWSASPKTGHVTVPKGKKWVDFEVGQKAVMARELESMLLTLEMKGGCRVRLTRGKRETCLFLAALYHWWVDVGEGQHRSHLRFRTVTADQALLHTPSVCRKIAAQLPGVGWTRSGAIAQSFGSVAAMVAADEKRWQEIEGVGKVLAKRIVEAIQVAGWTG